MNKWIKNKIGYYQRLTQWFRLQFWSQIMQQSWLRFYLKRYISFKEAIKIIGYCGYYEFNRHDRMWQNMGVTREEYYKNLLYIFIVRGALFNGSSFYESKFIKNKKTLNLYGRKFYSKNDKLQKIETEEFCKLDIYQNTSLVSNLKEEIYADICFNKNELYYFLNYSKI